MRRMFYKPVQCVDFDPRALARADERIAAAQARASIKTQIFEQELARVMSEHLKNLKNVR